MYIPRQPSNIDNPGRISIFVKNFHVSPVFLILVVLLVSLIYYISNVFLLRQFHLTWWHMNIGSVFVTNTRTRINCTEAINLAKVTHVKLIITKWQKSWTLGANSQQKLYFAWFSPLEPMWRLKLPCSLGKKSLYIRLGCRGDWPNINPPGWDPSTPTDTHANAL